MTAKREAIRNFAAQQNQQNNHFTLDVDMIAGDQVEDMIEEDYQQAAISKTVKIKNFANTNVISHNYN